MFRRGFIQANPQFFSLLMSLMDAALVAASGWLAYFLVHTQWPLSDEYLFVILLACLLTTMLFPGFQLYASWRGESLEKELRKILTAWGTVAVLLLLLGAAIKTTAVYSRLWMSYWFAVSGILLIASRLALRSLLHWLRFQGLNERRVIIAGSGELADTVTDRLLNNRWIGLKLLGCFAESDSNLEDRDRRVPVLGTFDRLAEFLDHHQVDQIWLAVPWSQQKIIDQVLYELRHSTVDIHMVPDLVSYRLLNTSITEIAGLPVLNLSTSPMHGISQILKLIEDATLSLIILLLISPLMLLIAIGVKLSSPGPILFRQKRHGYDGREVEIWKFRSMRVHQEEDDKVTQATRNDARITAFGAFLRNTSLDELPQFINVLQGRMSIVGPRPHAVVHNNYYKHEIEHYMLRHKVKPGITGWAQIHGLRGETDTLEKMRQRVEYDLYYIENWSLWFDLKIIGLTLLNGFVNPNAY
jgi:Undecaprenyl-phosphate glucose phosphotransferase